MAAHKIPKQAKLCKQTSITQHLKALSRIYLLACQAFGTKQIYIIWHVSISLHPSSGIKSQNSAARSAIQLSLCSRTSKQCQTRKIANFNFEFCKNSNNQKHLNYNNVLKTNQQSVQPFDSKSKHKSTFIQVSNILLL